MILNIIFTAMSFMTIAQTNPPNQFGLVYENAISKNIAGHVNIHPVKYKLHGIDIAANIYTPSNFDPSKKYPAIVVAHPNGGVKEQVAGLYAQRLAESGYITIVADAAYQGASGGQPRNIDKPAFRIEDIHGMADYVMQYAGVDANRIGLLGICGGGGYSLKAAQTDKRFKVVSTVSMFNSGVVRRNGFMNSGLSTIQDRLRQATEARTLEATTGEIRYAADTKITDEMADKMPFDLYREGHYYYNRTHAHPNSTFRYTMSSLLDLMEFDAATNMDLIDQPLLMIAGSKADSFYMTDSAFNLATGTKDKELFLIQGATHIQTYYVPEYVTQAVNKLNTFFNKNFAQVSGPEIQTTSGIVRGAIEKDVNVFKGIPYAAPPIGEFRWRPPQPVKAWEGVRDATKDCADCPQRAWPGSTAIQSEDCLFLNVWTPANATKKSKLPVMVWIHGGAFVAGSGSGPGTAGNSFAQQGVILLTINYRLGRLGHFAFPALSKEHPDEFKGSYAYMDQIAALKWVKENIAAFGGDPNNVTIFGFSAGGVSVHSLLTIPAAKGLFHKAIGESSGGRDGVLTGRPINKENADPLYPVSAETIGVNFARKHKINGNDADALKQLRSLSVEEIIDGGQEADSTGLRIYSGPILDGKLVVETAESAYQAGRNSKIPVIMGNCSGEIGGPFVSNAKSKEELFSSFGEHADEAKAAFDPGGDKVFEEVITKFNTDWVWGEPGRMTARSFVAKGAPAYMFQFGYVPVAGRERSRYGAGHGSEVSFVFNTLNARWGNPGEATPEEKELAKIMNAYWANFAKTGNPNGKDLPVWPAYTTQKEEILDVDLDGKVSGKTDPRKARLNFIEKLFKQKRERIQSHGI